LLDFLLWVSTGIPAGFKPERYVQLWKRNPFTLVTPEVPHARPSAFDKLFLTSWLKVGTTEVIFVQNSDTNEAERITAESANRRVPLELKPAVSGGRNLQRQRTRNREI